MTDTKLTFVDGTDALAYVILRPNGEGVVAEAAANGLSKEHAAYYLRQIADQWDPRPDSGGGNTMSDEPKIDDGILANDFADFLTRGLAAQRSVDEVIAASACAEKWYDEVGCGSADGVHRCRVSGRHSDHFCQDCDAMVIEDLP